MTMARRAVVVGGARTPFARAFAQWTALDAIALGVAAVRGMLDRHRVPWSEIDAITWGGVVLPPGAPNVGREIGLDLGLPPRVEAMTVSRACASGLQAITSAVSAIERGDADLVIAGGGDSTSNAPVSMPASFVHKVGPVALSGKAGPRDWLRLLGQLSPGDLVPVQPRVAERSTGMTMGEHAEDMARKNGISREAQDAFALTSHQKAAAAVAAGRFADEIVSVTNPAGETLFADTGVRGDSSLEKLAKLRPAFAKDGTLTAGNSTGLTDGAACVLVASEEKARALGLTPLAAFRSWAYVGVDPRDQLLMGPALAIPQALQRAGLSLGEIDRVDLHEAFAAQVLAVLKMLGSKAFAKERLGRDEAVGEVDPARLNVHGGSLALGHPFAATGARMVLTMSHELARTDAKTAVLGICAAGGLGAAAVLERA
jgi:acetyl-CoA acyltransferase